MKKNTKDMTPREIERRKKSRKRKALLVVLALLIVCSVTAVVINNSIKAPISPSIDIESIGSGTAPNLSKDKNKKPGVYSVLVLGTDKNDTLTDAMVVVSLDTVSGTLSSMNIPRDTMSNNVRRTNKKINGAYAGGLDNALKEVESLIGFKPDFNVLLSLDAIEEIVDALGGIEYEVPFRMKYDDPTQNLHINLQPGLQLLDGEKTVHFLRWRKNNYGIKGGYAEGDIGRIKGQQEFMEALAGKLMTPSGLLKVPKLIKVAFENVETNLTVGEMVWLAKEGIKVGVENFSMHILPGSSKTVDGLSYFIPYEKELLQVINEYFNPYTAEITDLDIVNPSQTQSKPKPSETKPTTPNKNPEEDELPNVEVKPEAKPETKPETSPETSPETGENPDTGVSPETPETGNNTNTDSPFNNVDNSVLG